MGFLYFLSSLSAESVLGDFNLPLQPSAHYELSWFLSTLEILQEGIEMIKTEFVVLE